MTARWIRAGVAAVVIAAGAAGAGACTQAPSELPPTEYQHFDLRFGTGELILAGRRVSIHLQAWVYSTLPADRKGLQVITTIGGPPVPVTLDDMLAPALLRAIPGMRPGGLRGIIVPPDLTAGLQGNIAPVPPNAVLIVEVEVVEILPPE